jgi:ABC-type dipeptide/oligopeptide/nickel transport system ATPase component
MYATAASKSAFAFFMPSELSLSSTRVLLIAMVLALCEELLFADEFTVSIANSEFIDSLLN